MNRTPKLLGLDIGFGFTKCVDGERVVIFPSSMRRNGDPPRGAGGYAIAAPDGDYQVGEDTGGLPLFENFARRPDRLFDTYGKNLALTAMASFSEQEAPLHVVIGLPFSQTPHWSAPLMDRLTGYHKIGIHQSDGGCVRKNVHIRKIRVVPHPMGTFTSLIMDARGRLRESPYRENKIALVDIGFRTTDVIVMTAARVSSRSSGTIEVGMASGIEAIAHKLSRETPAVPDLGNLLTAIRQGLIRIEDRTYNLEHLRETTYQWLSSALADRINYHLKDDWDVESVLLTGGGSADLAEYLAPLIDSEVVLIEHDRDARLSNVDGQLRLARHRWGATGYCGNER